MSHHTLLHRAVRPIVSGLARTGVPPDVVTALRLLTGLGAAACLLAGQGPAMDVGAAIFLVSMLLDRADGALARSTGRFSRFGSTFDLVSDCVSTMSLFVALGFGIGGRPGGIAVGTGLALGLGAAISIAVTFAALNRTEVPGDPRRPIDPDDAMLLVPVAIWCGQAPMVLFLAAGLSPLAAIVSVLLSVIRRRAPAVAVPVPIAASVPLYTESQPSRSVSTS